MIGEEEEESHPSKKERKKERKRLFDLLHIYMIDILMTALSKNEEIYYRCVYTREREREGKSMHREVNYWTHPPDYTNSLTLFS